MEPAWREHVQAHIVSLRRRRTLLLPWTDHIRNRLPGFEQGFDFCIEGCIRVFPNDPSAQMMKITGCVICIGGDNICPSFQRHFDNDPCPFPERESLI